MKNKVELLNFRQYIREGTTVLKNKKEIISINDLKLEDNILVQGICGFISMIVYEINKNEGMAKSSKLIAFLKYDGESWVCNLLLDGKVLEDVRIK